MMTDKEYNNFFRSRLDHFSSRVDDKLWENIRAENKKKERHGLTAAKYVLPVIFLIFSLATADKMTTNTGTKAIFLAKNKSTKSDKNIANESSATVKKATDKSTFVLTKTSQQYSSNIHETKLKALPAFTFRQTKIFDNQNKSEAEKLLFSKSDQSAQTQMDSINNDAKKVVKKDDKALHKQADSTADITVDPAVSSDRLFLYLFASPDLALVHITSGNSNYQQLRNQQSKQQLSYSAGARLRVNINEHWSGNIGVQFTRVNEKIRMQNSTSDNHSSNVDLPLIAGYRVYKNKVEIDANAGIILNISSTYKGYISSVENEPVDVHLAHVYKNSTSLSYYAGVQLLFKPANKITFFAEPYFKYQPGNIVNSFQPFEEHIQKIGALLGARYQFK